MDIIYKTKRRESEDKVPKKKLIYATDCSGFTMSSKATTKKVIDELNEKLEQSDHDEITEIRVSTHASHSFHCTTAYATAIKYVSKHEMDRSIPVSTSVY
jgi:mannose-6-phosphate isomerase class I